MTRVAIVTGGNKGVGYGVCKGLSKKFDGDIFLTARSEERGLAAVEQEWDSTKSYQDLVRITLPVSTTRLLST
jgi:NAD(P)-dependent dehydrogenase (short-subunit alcohol dehydrogenase family)